MELRYYGFDQSKNARAYRFGLIVKSEATREFVVTADLRLFLTHHVGIQEGPSLCARKLAADLEACAEGPHELSDLHELTDEDMRVHAKAKATEEERRIEARKGTRKRSNVPPPQAPWRGMRP